MKDCKFTGYTLIVKKKHARKNKYLDGKKIYDLLDEINKKEYHKEGNERSFKIFNEEVCLFFWKDHFPKYDNSAINNIKFKIGRITDETFSAIDEDGKIEDGVPLQDGKKLCFLTHGCFLFKKFQGKNVCCLIIEKRFHTISLYEFLQYLKKFDNTVSFEIGKIVDERDILDVIDDIDKASLISVREKEISIESRTLATKVIEKKKEEILSADNIVFRLFDSPTVKGQLFDFAKKLFKLKRKPEDMSDDEYMSEVIKDTINSGKIKVLGKMSGTNSYRWINLVEYVYLFFLRVEQNNKGVIDSDDLFKKFDQVITNIKASSLLNSSKEFYDRIQIV